MASAIATRCCPRTTFDEEVNAKAIDFMERAAKADKPFFLWWNSKRCTSSRT